MRRLTAMLAQVCVATSATAGEADLLSHALSLYENKCPLIESNFEVADQEFRSGPWRPVGNWGKTPLGRYGGWGNEDDTIVVAFQNLRFEDSRFWQCRVSVLVSDLAVDPTEFVNGDTIVDGHVEPQANGGFAAIWRVSGGLFTSVNALYDGTTLNLVRMAITEETGNEQ